MVLVNTDLDIAALPYPWAKLISFWLPSHSLIKVASIFSSILVKKKKKKVHFVKLEKRKAPFTPQLLLKCVNCLNYLFQVVLHLLWLSKYLHFLVKPFSTNTHISQPNTHCPSRHTRLPLRSALPGWVPNRQFPMCGSLHALTADHNPTQYTWTCITATVGILFCFFHFRYKALF